MLVRRPHDPATGAPASESDVIETSMTLTFPTKPCHCGLSRGWTLYEVNLAVTPDGAAIAQQCIWECEACKVVRATGAVLQKGTQ